MLSSAGTEPAQLELESHKRHPHTAFLWDGQCCFWQAVFWQHIKCCVGAPASASSAIVPLRCSHNTVQLPDGRYPSAAICTVVTYFRNRYISAVFARALLVSSSCRTACTSLFQGGQRLRRPRLSPISVQGSCCLLNRETRTLSGDLLSARTQLVQSCAGEVSNGSEMQKVQSRVEVLGDMRVSFCAIR